MKRILFVFVLSFVSLCASAQTKTAYCDIYARGGGLNLNITISFDGNSIDYLEPMNIGEILNIMASDGWVIDREIVIPRHGIPITRHKLHLIMKKEYKYGEDPFSLFKKDTYDRRRIIYNGMDAIVFSEHGDYATIIAVHGIEGTWDEAVQYIKSLKGYWRLPSKEELISMSTVLQSNNYWSYEEVNNNHAVYYNQENKEYYNANKEQIFYILPIAVVHITDLE